MTTAGSILCIGRNRRNQELLHQVLTTAGYSVEVALTYEDLSIDELVEENGRASVSLILLDVTGFDARIWQFCQASSSRAIPLFIITPSDSAHLLERHTPCIRLLVKPLDIRSLLTLLAHTLQISQ
ncbi:hypothetical protein PN498_07625 [Oscillatoria sp. CS-180]|uniref:hypothetical protein n=1 Tax=Oscillatoria sp. CS-180 TaxID=3021720 RepID=UPI00232D0A20|nr:hypothetical protein [Oscillatoria sp. CS-180]MDB9525850.1 hypothetical protein [Oscillatoria sp. CS-180]